MEEIIEQLKDIMHRVSLLEMNYVNLQTKLDQIIASVADLSDRVKKLELSYTETHTKLNVLLWGVGLVCGGVITLLINALLNGVKL